MSLPLLIRTLALSDHSLPPNTVTAAPYLHWELGRQHMNLEGGDEIQSITPRAYSKLALYKGAY